MAVTAPRPRAQLQSRRRYWIACAVILAALGFLIVRGLGNATVYFKTADEAVAQKATLGTHRFRVEGLVVGGSIKQHGTSGVDFTIAGKNVEVPIVHSGNLATNLVMEQTGEMQIRVAFKSHKMEAGQAPVLPGTLAL